MISRDITIYSMRTRLALRASMIALGGAALIAGAPAFAQDQAGQPTNDTAAPAAVASTAVSTDGTPGPDNTTAQTVAEDPAQDVGEDIVVSGIRASLDSSARIKRNSTLIVDSVSAEDIGKLPDVSIADSLARLPGVTAQRLEGRDQRLSIRGLGPDFSTTLLNGREQVTVGDNRGVEFDQYPAEFFKNVNVYKSADASLIAAGIAGTVDLRMLRPLDTDQRVVAIAARGQMNGIDKLTPEGSRYGYRASATYVDQFADDTFGVAIGVSASRIPSQDERYNAWGYSTDANGNLELGGAKPYVQSNVLDRYGAVGTFEFKPSDNFHSTLDVLYSHFQETQNLKGIEFPLGYGGVNNDPASDGYATAVHTSNFTTVDGFDTEETFSNVHAVQRNDYNQRKANDLSIGWNNVIGLSDKMRFVVDASWSRAKRTDYLLETYTGTGFGKSGPGDTINVSQNKDGTYTIVPTLDYTDTSIFKITDPQGWGNNGTAAVIQSGFLNRPSFKDDLKSLRADLEGDIDNSVIKGWEVGANYSRRKKTSAYTSYFLCPPGGAGDCTVSGGTPTSLAVPDEALLGHNISLDYLGVPGVLGIDPVYLANNVFNQAYDNRPDSLARDNTVTEDVITGYAKVNIDGTVGGKALKGSLGLQVVHSEQQSSGAIASLNNGVVTVAPAYDKATYTNFLPSATMAVELIPGGYVKLGASQTMVRPRLDQERVTQAVGINVNNIPKTDTSLFPVFSSTGGNVQLKPYQSTNIDVSFEKYFGGGGYVALTGYFKNLTDFVDPSNSYAYDFSGLLGALSPADQQTVLSHGANIGLVSAPANTGRGEILGTEATLSLPFSQISRALDGFGVFASGTYTSSTIKYGNNQTPITLPGLSKWVGSGSLYYEKYGIQLRASYRYRSKFLGEVAGLSAAPTYRQVKPEGILDAQIGYEFQTGSLKGLSILLEGKNLTDRPFITYQNNDTRQVIDYQRYGRDYYVGLSYKF
ncbi:TonB-dependent receptor [Sphingomonas koreensis]|nr:TonB-dependent receptor [Sphingomonas koreensis]